MNTQMCFTATTGDSVINSLNSFDLVGDPPRSRETGWGVWDALC